MKKYAIIIPVHKAAYIKEFNGRDDLYLLIFDKVGSRVRAIDTVPDFGEDYKIIASELNNGAENEIATFISMLPESEDIHGPAIILYVPEGGDAGCSLEVAENIRDYINNLRL